MPAINLLLVIADQWRASALGVAQDADPVHTPYLDRLATTGLRATQAVSTYPVCSPARSMLMTGQYPHRNGVSTNLSSAAVGLSAGLDPQSRCWSDVLAGAGYDTAYLGKWHLDLPDAADALHGEGTRDDGRVWDAWTPPGERRHGFTRWYSHGCSDQHLSPHYWVDDAPQDSPRRAEEWSARHETDVALEILSEQGRGYREHGTPFATVLSYNPPHPPFEEVPQELLDLVPADAPLLTRPNVDTSTDEGRRALAAARQYFAAVAGVDEQIGRLLDALADEGVAEDTLVVFTSDHGMQLGSHGLLAKNVWFDESLLVPLVLRLPGRLRSGTSDALISTPDLAPTLLGLLDLGDHVPREMQGRDLSGVLLADGSDADGPARALYLRTPSTAGPEDLRGLRTHEAMLVAERRDGQIEPLHLYDLGDDPFQRRDVLAERPEQARRLLAELRDELARVGDPWSEQPVLA